jgi:hypothetical protein
MSPDQIQSFFAFAIGFAMAGMLATGYQFATHRPASFRLLQRGPSPSTFATVPFLAFAAPFIIMRNTILARQEGRRFEMMMLATVVAGFWSLMSGTVVVMVLGLLRI